MTRAFQQFSRFKLGKEDLTQHHLLKHDQVRKSGYILISLPRELGEPTELFGDAEELVNLLPLAEASGRDVSARLTQFSILRVRTVPRSAAVIS